jgi:NADH-quinone oxidoreductase subunit L
VLASVEKQHLDHATELGKSGTAVAVAGLGAALASWLYLRRPELTERIAAAFKGGHQLIVNKYYVDEIYDALIVRPLVAVSDRVLFRVVDAVVIDGVMVNGTARGVRALAAHGLKYAQSGLAQTYVFFMIAGAAAQVAYLVR